MRKTTIVLAILALCASVLQAQPGFDEAKQYWEKCGNRLR